MKNFKKSNTIPHFGILYLLLDTVVSLILFRERILKYFQLKTKISTLLVRILRCLKKIDLPKFRGENSWTMDDCCYYVQFLFSKSTECCTTGIRGLFSRKKEFLVINLSDLEVIRSTLSEEILT